MRYRVRAAGLALATGTILVAALALAAGCGSGSKNDDGKRASMEAYLSCLKEHGVDLTQMGPPGGQGSPGALPSGSFSPHPRPSGSFRPGARPSGSFPARGERSGGAWPGGPGDGPGIGDQAPAGVDQATWKKAQQACASLRPSRSPRGERDNGASAAYQNCLKDHGVTASASSGTLESSDPKVAAAMKACAPLRPTSSSKP